jgi:hypothetical protein
MRFYNCQNFPGLVPKKFLYRRLAGGAVDAFAAVSVVGWCSQFFKPK